MAKSIIKFAGPDSQDNFKVLQVKGRLVVDPGKVYSRGVQDHLSCNANNRNFEATTVAPTFKPEDGDSVPARTFGGPVIDYAEWKGRR